MNRYDRRLQVIYFAILMSTLIYGAIAWTSTNAAVPAKTLPDELRAPLTIGLYAAAVVAFVIATIVRARRLLIVRWAMLEAACICGLVAAFVFGDWRLYAIVWIPAVAGFIALYPRVRMGER
jgi:cell division protein FtsW (lipid II flippase)